jgi:hypothetical protein
MGSAIVATGCLPPSGIDMLVPARSSVRRDDHLWKSASGKPEPVFHLLIGYHTNERILLADAWKYPFDSPVGQRLRVAFEGFTNAARRRVPQRLDVRDDMRLNCCCELTRGGAGCISALRINLRTDLLAKKVHD